MCQGIILGKTHFFEHHAGGSLFLNLSDGCRVPQVHYGRTHARINRVAIFNPSPYQCYTGINNQQIARMTPMKHPEISVIIPCHKEAEVIETNILTVNEYLRSLFDRYEIVVVTDGSPDGTADVIDALITSRSDIPLTHIRFAENRGKGAAVKAGILASRFETVLFMDADLTIPIDELDEFMSALVQSDIVIASRLAPGARFDEPVPWYRVIMARGFHLLQILILGNFEFSDTQCGFKLFRRNAALDIFKRITIKRFAFDAELLFLARHNDYRVTILPVTVRKDPRDTNVRIVRDPIEMLFSLLRIRWNSMRGTYDNTVD